MPKLACNSGLLLDSLPHVNETTAAQRSWARFLYDFQEFPSLLLQNKAFFFFFFGGVEGVREGMLDLYGKVIP